MLYRVSDNATEQDVPSLHFPGRRQRVWRPCWCRCDWGGWGVGARGRVWPSPRPSSPQPPHCPCRPVSPPSPPCESGSALPASRGTSATGWTADCVRAYDWLTTKYVTRSRLMIPSVVSMQRSVELSSFLISTLMNVQPPTINLQVCRAAQIIRNCHEWNVELAGPTKALMVPHYWQEPLEHLGGRNEADKAPVWQTRASLRQVPAGGCAAQYLSGGRRSRGLKIQFETSTCRRLCRSVLVWWEEVKGVEELVWDKYLQEVVPLSTCLVGGGQEGWRASLRQVPVGGCAAQYLSGGRRSRELKSQFETSTCRRLCRSVLVWWEEVKRAEELVWDKYL